MLKDLDTQQHKLIVDCPICDKEFESVYIQDEVKSYMEEHDSYENHSVECPHCEAITVLNLNLPQEELEETFFEEVGVDEFEKQQRRTLKRLYKEFVFEEKQKDVDNG